MIFNILYRSNKNVEKEMKLNQLTKDIDWNLIASQKKPLENDQRKKFRKVFKA